MMVAVVAAARASIAVATRRLRRVPAWRRPVVVVGAAVGRSRAASRRCHVGVPSRLCCRRLAEAVLAMTGSVMAVNGVFMGAQPNCCSGVL
jgi:hypothetical protein